MSVQSEINRIKSGVAAAYAAAYAKDAPDQTAETIDNLAVTIAAIESGSQVATGTISVTTSGITNFSITPGFVVRHLVFVNQKESMTNLPNCQLGYWINNAGYVQGSSTSSSSTAADSTNVTVQSTATSTTVSWTGCKLYSKTLFWFAVA